MKHKQRRRRTLSLLTRIWQNHLTLGGRTIAAMLLVCLPSLTSLDSGIVPLFSAGVTLLAAVSFIGYVGRPRLRLHVLAPPRVMRENPCAIHLELTNAGRRDAYQIDVRWTDLPTSWHSFNSQSEARISCLKIGQTVTLTLRVEPRQRGVFAWPNVQTSSTFPLHLVRFSQTFAVHHRLRVYPRHSRLKTIPPTLAGILAARHAECSAQRAGTSWEYFGNREYQPGLIVRRWDFGSWARLGRPVVREYHEQHDRAVAMMIDVRPVPHDPTGEALERLLERVAAVAELLCEQRVAMLWIATQHGKRPLQNLSLDGQLRAVQDFLAEVESADMPLPPAGIAPAQISAPVAAPVLLFSGHPPDVTTRRSLGRHAMHSDSVFV